MSQKNRHSGSSLDDFLIEEGLFEACSEEALKRVLAYQIQEAMKEKELSKTHMAKLMDTSRASLNRLLDPANASVTLKTLQKAAKVIGQRIEVRFVSG